MHACVCMYLCMDVCMYGCVDVCTSVLYTYTRMCMYYMCLGVCLNTCMCTVGCLYEFKCMVMCYSDSDPFRRSELSNRRPKTRFRFMPDVDPIHRRFEDRSMG